MFIKNIKIYNFRNIKTADLKIENKISFFIGNNAQGKTNIIESIYTSAFLKSFRTQKKEDLIKEGEDEAKVDISVKNYGVNNLVSLFLNKNNKYIKVNNKKPDNYKYLNVIIFYPDEINKLSHFPYFRRNLIDRSIFYINYSYIDIYKKYFKCLKQRNAELKTKKTINDCWKDQLIFYGSEIIRERLKYISKLNSIFGSDNFKNINSEKYGIIYSRKCSDNSIENLLEEEFFRKRERERQLGYTLAGPHRDDILFYINDRPVEAFASQGQKRSLLISFKAAQILDYKTVQGHYPVLILDDMSSELDSDRKNILLENLLENSGQVFITSTDLRKPDIAEKSTFFKVDNGIVSLAD